MQDEWQKMREEDRDRGNAQNSPETTAKLPKERKEKMGGMRTMM